MERSEEQQTVETAEEEAAVAMTTTLSRSGGVDRRAAADGHVGGTTEAELVVVPAGQHAGSEVTAATTEAAEDHSGEEPSPPAGAEEDEEPDSTSSTNSTTNNRSSYTADSLMALLQQVRSRDGAVRQIALDRRGVPAAYLQALLEAAAGSPQIRRVRLRQAIADGAAAAALARVLAAPGTALTDLRVSRSEVLDLGGRAVARALATSEHCRLRRLVWEGSHMTDAGLAALIQAVARQPAIQIFKIGRHPLMGAASVNALVALLQPAAAASSSSSHPDDGSSGSSSRSNTGCQIRKLDLRGCHLGDAGTAALARRALTVNASLQSLGLGRNRLTDAAAREIAGALRRHRRLRRLDLRDNPGLTDAGAAALAAALRGSAGGNDSLQQIELRRCPAVSEAMRERLLDLLRVHAHGPELARRTKRALEGLLSEEERERSERCDTSSSTATTTTASHHANRDDSISSSSYGDDDDETDNAEDEYQDGGREGVIRETTAAATPRAHHPRHNRQPLLDCVICFDQPAAAALLPCRHRNCCEACAARLKTCHMCRETIVKVFPLASPFPAFAGAAPSTRDPS